MRYLPLGTLGQACGLSGEEIAESVRMAIKAAPEGMFELSPSNIAVGLKEWAGWLDFSESMEIIATKLQEPAFEPRIVQDRILLAASGAVRAGAIRQDDILDELLNRLSPE